MALKRYIILMLCGTILCWAAWLLVVTKLDPTSAGWVGFSFFYSSLFLALLGTFSLLGLGFRIYILRHEVIFRQVGVAFRQAMSFSLLIVVALFLESKNLFTWWNALILVLVLTFVEFAVLTIRRHKSPL